MTNKRREGQARLDDAASRATIQPPLSSSERETAMPSSVDSQPSASSLRAQLGKEFGRYRILECLGAGAMGTVYKAHDQQLDRMVALKIPKFTDPELLARFYREARSAATVTHPNICPVHDVGELEGTHYISMEFVEGKELSAFIKPGKPQPIKQIVSVIRKLALALHEAHQTGVVHRDLKPDNVMIDKRGTPIIMDFGLAIRETAGDARMTHAGGGQLMGTPAYMSPEQVDGDREKIGAASDVYSLGIMFYEMLTSQLPYQGSVAAVLAQIINANPKPPTQLRPDIDSQVESMCLKMISGNLSHRYATMREVAQDLTSYLKNLVQASESSSPMQAAQSTPAQLVTPAPTPAPFGEDFGFEPLPTIRTTDLNTQKPKRKTRSKQDSPMQPAPTVDSQKPDDANMLQTAIKKFNSAPTWARISTMSIAGLIVLFSVITLFVSSDDQTVKIEIDDPKAQVFIDGKHVTIKNLGADIELSTGPHGYQIRRGDVVVKADSFTVLDGKNEVVRITVRDKPTSPPTDPNPVVSV